MCTCTYMYIYGGMKRPELTSGAFFSHSPPYFLRKTLIIFGFTFQFGNNSWRVSCRGSFHLYLEMQDAWAFHVGDKDSDSGFHTCIMSSLAVNSSLAPELPLHSMKSYSMKGMNFESFFKRTNLLGLIVSFESLNIASLHSNIKTL